MTFVGVREIIMGLGLVLLCRNALVPALLVYPRYLD